MTSAKAAAEFLSGFRGGGAGDPMERLGRTLAKAGADGYSLAEALDRSQLSRDDLFRALSMAQKYNLVETIEVAGEQRIRLTPDAQSLY